MGRKPSYEELAQRVKELESPCPSKETEEGGAFWETNWFQLLLNTMRDGIDVVTYDYLVVYANDHLKKMIGCEEVEDRRCYEAFLGRESPCENCPMRRASASGRTETEEMRLDEGRVIELRASPMILPSGERGAIELVRDISSRKAAEDALKREKERFRILVEKSPLGICLIRAEGRYAYVNPKFTETFGYTLEDVPRGREWFKKAFPDPAYRKEVVSCWVREHDGAAPGEPHPRTLKVTCKDGSKKVVHFRSVTLEGGDMLVISEDITEKKRLESMLVRAQRMEAAGTLAGGIAHDFNNLLMGIQGNTSLMLMEVPPSHPHYHRLENIEQHVKSGADLTKQLLGFARGGKYEVKPSSLNETLRQTLSMFGRTTKELSVHTAYEEEIWTVEIDRSQIKQVFLNILVNAWQAMPGGGDLYIETENVVLDDRYVTPYRVPAGRYAKASITDTGTGMDEATRQRIFDPFFTTKPMGRGTGLGLASAYGIVKNHGGIINVYSERGRGSTFNVYLPASQGEVVEEKAEEEEILQGTETVLLVDDEEIILEVGEALLKSLGYEVVLSSDGKEALSTYAENQDRVALVILDMVMPDM
ncbi:MAG: PAS domain S-box protein, partial [Deltaproteobacteria bacterium]|nr:PAS domain S-box protein [Deltaproteobacteria bacterium]